MAQRIISLVPSATETLFALGLGDRVRAVSHECDFPPEARRLPCATHSRLFLAPDATGAEIDAAVRRLAASGEPAVEVLEETFAHVEPDLVIAQEACEVCAATPADARVTLKRVALEAPVLTLHPHTLDDALADMGRIAEAAGAPERGARFVADLRARMDGVARVAARARSRPRVAVLDWLDPPMVAGHWVPDLVHMAGGEPLLVERGHPSRWTSCEEVVVARPDVLVVAPCGFDLARTRAEARALPAFAGARVHALDGNAYTSRCGPRLADALELLALALHPGAFEARFGARADEVPRIG